MNKSPLLYGLENDFREIGKILISKGADINVEDN